MNLLFISDNVYDMYCMSIRNHVKWWLKYRLRKKYIMWINTSRDRQVNYHTWWHNLLCRIRNVTKPITLLALNTVLIICSNNFPLTVAWILLHASIVCQFTIVKHSNINKMLDIYRQTKTKSIYIYRCTIYN